MINIKDIKGKIFKKELSLNRCQFSYHNKNNNGGNFTFDFYGDAEFNENTDFSLGGNYTRDGYIFFLELSSIRLGMFSIFIDLNEVKSIEDLIKYLKGFYRGRILAGL